MHATRPWSRPSFPTSGEPVDLSGATETARRQDLVHVATRLAERLGRPPAAEDTDRLSGELGRLEVTDLGGSEFLDALADYAETHAPRSVRRLMSTWRGHRGCACWARGTRVIPVGSEVVETIATYLVSRAERAGRHRQGDPPLRASGA